MTISRFSVLLAALLLAACGTPAVTNAAHDTPKPAATAVAEGVRALPVAEQQALAFKTVFGKAEPVEEARGEGFETKAGKLIWQGDRAVLITVTESEGACHACAGSLGVYYLVPKGDGFQVTGKFPEAVAGDGYGQAPVTWSVSDKFGPVPVIYSEFSWQGQGYTCLTFDLTELRPDKPARIARVPTFYDDSDTGSDEAKGEIEGKFKTIVPGKSFTLHYAGAATFDETWTLGADGQYKLAGKTRMLTC